MLQRHALEQKESESGAKCVNRDMLENLALRYMGLNADNSILLTTFYGKCKQFQSLLRYLVWDL